VAHDASVGDQVIIVNQSAVAGHCVIEDDVIIGGLCGIHQFVRIGRSAVCAPWSPTTSFRTDSWGRAVNGRAEPCRAEASRCGSRNITALRVAFQTLKRREGSFMGRARRQGAESDNKHVTEMVDSFWATPIVIPDAG
jgi:UDP-N-acetylglucosamine acyltransferase